MLLPEGSPNPNARTSSVIPFFDCVITFSLRTSVHHEKKSLLGQPQAGQSRTIYLGGLPTGCEHWDVHRQILDQVRGAPVEALRLVPAKQCAFLDFFDPVGALAFAERWDKGSRRLVVREKEVKVAWAGSSKLGENIQMATRNGATRNVYLSGIDVDEDGAEAKADELREIFKAFGPVDIVKIVPERHIAFVHMASVSAAMEAVDVLTSRPEWKGHRISFGSDRCGERPPPGVHPSLQAKRRIEEPAPYPYDLEEGPSHGIRQMPYRTIYLGGLPPETTLEELCDVIRGGLIQSIRMAPAQKHCAFVTFVDEPSAISFYDFFSQHGMTIRGTALRLGWSKPSSVPLSVTQALQKGATRTVYIGNIQLEALGPDPKTYLLADCAKRFGPVESINVVPAKNIAFVSFCNLLDAVKALAGLREAPEYAQCKLAYGKDRCAQSLRPLYPLPMPFPPSNASLPSSYASLPSSFPSSPYFLSSSSSPPPPSSHHYYPPIPAPAVPFPYYPNPMYPAPTHYVPMMPMPYMVPVYQNPPPPHPGTAVDIEQNQVYPPPPAPSREDGEV